MTKKNGAAHSSGERRSCGEMLRTSMCAAIAISCVVSIERPTAVSAQSSDTTGERQFLSRVRRLTVEGRRAGEGYWSPDGRRLVFQSEREPGNPFYQIYTLDLATGDTKRISPGMGKTTCAFFRPRSDE